ncbi:MAG: YggU family protein [Candidatus Margulisiibacteriota bacterium]|nr:MAG: YggU family protein [Candidatus Margulisbacteria bacterium GWD2_39_127]OGI03903.1 MAG: YggU family protein [Candidatus Margulisbacteria bacterium GWF2_38_17]OGI08792.1 MAG: YggU family protein [Candidatus Margulisbacteria bacterium GWE2_39_32]PZM78624.1 MAG: YggU family protein [Candidatus Margulisiibacteriota bacterium]HAR61964.1 YggU family protein [Candidatus Margulisiibacteriota bacterium]
MYLEEHPSYIILNLRVMPKTHKREVAGFYNDRLKIKINAAPEGGKANKEVIAFLSEILKISKSSIEIIHGELSQNKTVKITGIDKKYAESCIVSP